MKKIQEHIKNIRQKRGSLYTFLVRGFILLLLVIAGLGALLFMANRVIIYNMNLMPSSSKLLAQTEELQSEEYDKVSKQIGRSLGRHGYFEVVDESGKVLYCNQPKNQNTYTKEQLSYITDVENGTFYELTVETKGAEITGYIVTRYCQEEDGDDSYNVAEGVAVLDADRNVLYTNLQWSQTHLTEQEVTYLIDSSDAHDSNLILQKYQFVTKSGATRYLMIHCTSINQRYAKFAGRLTAFTIAFFVFSMIVAVIIAAVIMVRKVRHPLHEIRMAMNDIAEGNKRRLQLDSSATSKEFNQMVDTFNLMSDRLEETELQQKELQEQKRKMLADISHDLKTPITVIQGYVDAMKDGLIPVEAQQQYLDIISRKTSMLSELINTFSDYSRLEHPDYEMNLESGNLNEYFREYVAYKYQELALIGYQVDVNIPDTKIPCRFDKSQLKRVFENIIGNALKYTGAGTTIFVSIVRKDKCAIIEIGDDGPGIPDELRKTVFDPFVVGDDSRTSGKGTGLGLSIAKKIVEAHGGNIGLIPKEEGREGTWYRIILPVE